MHITPEGYNKCYDLAKAFIKDEQPDRVILLGDFADTSALSHWNLKKRGREIEGKRYDAELKVLDKELDWLNDNCDTLVWLEGNHENWVEQYIDHRPELEGLLEYPVRLNLKERGIQWIPYGDYPENFYKVGQMNFIHGLYAGKYHAAKHWRTFGCNLCYGHTHVPQSHSHTMAQQKPYKVQGLGCLCDHKAPYLKGRPGSWMSGFGVMYMAKNGEFNLYVVDIINKRFYFNGKSYK